MRVERHGQIAFALPNTLARFADRAQDAALRRSKGRIENQRRLTLPMRISE
jgi:hypothetical protein